MVQTRATAIPHRKQELLDAVVDHIATTGTADLSTRTLASAIGTSHRMLLYYFGSKEELLREIYAGLRVRFVEKLASVTATTLRPMLSGTWRELRSDVKTLRLLRAIFALSTTYPERFADLAGEHTVALNTTFGAMLEGAGAPADVAPRLGVLVGAAVRGIQFDLIQTGDVERLDQAVDDLLDLIEQVFLTGAWPDRPRRR